MVRVCLGVSVNLCGATRLPSMMGIREVFERCRGLEVGREELAMTIHHLLFCFQINSDELLLDATFSLTKI